MKSQTDQQLLRDYAASRSEPAFAELARRHVDLVYSAALRMVRDSHLAEDVTQGAFVALAQNASELRGCVVLSGWLHRTARNLAVKVVRSNVRRRTREQEAVAMNESSISTTDDAWKNVAPHLDAALIELSDADRDALLLRYFERKSAQEMAEILGINAEAAQKRVNRAVERLRDLFAKKGIAAGAGGIAAVLSANAVQAAPAALTATVVAASVAIPTSTILTATKIIAMTTLQKTLITAALVASLGAAVYEAHQSAGLRAEIEALRQQQSPLDEQLRHLQQERDSATNRVAGLNDELQRAKKNSAELLKLRGEVAHLRENAMDPGTGDPSMMKLASKVALLKKKLEQMPNRRIGELQFASEKDWADAAWKANLNTEDGVREALSTLRGDAINTFLNEMMKNAMNKYLAAHNDIVPASLSELKTYFDVPVTDDMLSHYKLMQTGTVNKSDDLVQLAFHADDKYDSTHGMSINGAWGGGFNNVESAVNLAIGDYRNANFGQSPTDPSQLQGYLKEPVEAEAIQRYLDKNNANPPRPEITAVNPVLRAYSDANNGAMPRSPADLLPYITTPEQMAAFEKLEPDAATLAPALKAYSAANNGQLPRTPADVLPYVTTAEQKAAYQKLTGTAGSK